ncbi:MAG: hypothetical protein EA402_05365 [Planctomycetota bacterium]|nr:MAG: hypothetical protein EA402_05365 [Planctomycetota bacterium]
MPDPCAITALGCIAAPGAGIAAQLSALRRGGSALRLSHRRDLPLSQHMPLGHVDAPLPPAPFRNLALGLAAAEEALANGALTPPQRRRLGLIVGTSTGGMGPSEQAYIEQGSEYLCPHYRHQQMHVTTRLLAQHLGIQGPQSTHAVACVSSACALAEAMTWLRLGICEACLVVGCDALTRVTTAGFNSLQLIDPSGCKPFTEQRQGMNVGEAGAALLLETRQHATARGAPIAAWLAGWGLRGDGYHPTSPDPQARQLVRAIGDALNDAGVKPEDIDWINAHGTGTRDNDATEATAFAQALPGIAVSSLKGLYGHTMGAAAAVEAVACCLALQHQEIYPNHCPPGTSPIAGLPLVSAHRRQPLRAICSTNLAFGGMDAALVFRGASACA